MMMMMMMMKPATPQCLEILSVFAKALLGSLPDLVPPEVLPVFRRAVRGGGGEPDSRDEHAVRHVHHTESLLDNFVLNIAIAPESRQTAALCLLLTIPEVWAMNGCVLPAKLVPLHSLNFKDVAGSDNGGSISFVSAAAAVAAAAGTAIAATGGNGSSVTSAGASAAGHSVSPEFGPGATGAGAPQGVNRGRGWSVGGAEEAREKQELLRKQAEVRRADSTCMACSTHHPTGGGWGFGCFCPTVPAPPPPRLDYCILSVLKSNRVSRGVTLRTGKDERGWFIEARWKI